MKPISLLDTDPLTELINSMPATAAGAGDDVIFGMTLTGFLLASFFSLIGFAYLVYAKKQSRLIVGLTGVALMVFPYIITNTLPMAIIGVVLAVLPYLLARFGIDL